MSGKRRSYESGHRPKFMVVVDKTPECARAVHFASRRTARTGASLVMLAVVDPPDNFEWLGVGERAEEIIELIREDEDISFLVLAAGSSKEGPGPLVSTLAGRAASTFPIPIVVVPGGLTDEEIDALAG